MKNKSGFTIVELTIVIIIIGILAGITIFSYSKIQSNARDTNRKGDATAIADALETYYGKNGEYPSVRSIVNNYTSNTGAVVASKIGVSVDVLKTPRMPRTATNALTSAANPTNDYIAYSAKSTVNPDSCQTVLTGGCDQFTMKYREETGTLITIESRHKGRAGDTGTAPNASEAPDVSVALVSGAVKATAVADPCDPVTLIAKYSFRYSVNGGAWTSYDTFNTTSYRSISGAQGSHYEFQAVTRCDNGAVAGTQSPDSEIVPYDYPINAPTVPTVTVVATGTTVTAASSPVSCPAGAAAQYSFQSRTNDGTWSAWSAWSATTTASPAPTAVQGVKYGYKVQTRCSSSTANSAATQSVEKTDVKPIATPAAPTVTATTSGVTTTWKWTTPACPAGTSAQYKYRYIADWDYTSEWFGPQVLSQLTWDTTEQGYQYISQIQLSCFNANATSGYSATAQDDYIRPVAAPGTASWHAYKSGARIIYMRVSATCGPSASLYTQFREWSGDIKFLSGPNSGSTGWWDTDTYRVSGYGSPYTGGISNNYDIPSASRFKSQANQKCVNTTTNRASAYSLRTSPQWTFGSLGTS